MFRCCLLPAVNTMERLAFKMKLFAGKESEYKKRHDEIWPELSSLLTSHGISAYSIFLDEKTLELYGSLTISDPALYAALPNSPVMQRWWQYMKDIMESNSDGSPVAVQLREVFYLP